jgi:hypothetical protein
MATKVQTDIKGLNTGGISKMKTAITDYKSAIVPGVKNLGISIANVEKSLKGSGTVKSINKMGAEIQTEVSDLLSLLDAFSGKLDEVKAAYAAHDAAAAAKIDNATTKIKAVKS